MRFLPTRRGALLTAAVATGMVWLLFFGLLNGWYPELQRRVILRAMVEGFGVDAELGGVRGSVMSGLTLEQLVVRPNPSNKTSDANELPLVVDEVRIDLDLSRVYEDRVVVVRSFEIENIALRIERGADGEWNFLGLPTGRTPAPDPSDHDVEAPPLTLEIAQFIVRNANITLRHSDPADPGELAATGRLATRDISWPFKTSQAAPPTVTADLRVTGGSFRQARVQTARLRVTGNQERLELKLERADLKLSKTSQLHVSGAMSASLEGGQAKIEMVDGRIAFTHLDLSALDIFDTLGAPGTLTASPPSQRDQPLPTTDLNGQLHVWTPENTIPVAPANLPLELKIDLDASTIASLNLVSAHARAAYELESGAWSLDAALLDTPESHLEASGAGTHDALDDIRIVTTGLPIEDVLSVLNLQADAVGEVDVMAQLSGPLNDPTGTVSVEGGVAIALRPDLEFAADVTLLGGQRFQIEQFDLDTTHASRLSLATTSPAMIAREGTTWSIANLNLNGPSGTLGITSLAIADSAVSLEASVANLNIQAFAEFFSSTEAPGGLLSGNLKLDQRLEQLKIDGELTWLSPSYRDTSAERISLKAKSIDGANTIEGNVKWDFDNSVAISLRLPSTTQAFDFPAVVRHPEFELAFFAEEMPARVFHNFLPADPEQKERDPNLFKGTLSGAFGAKGTPAGPEVVGSGTWANAQWGTAVADNVKLTADTTGKALSLTLEISDQGRNGFVANASIDLAHALEQPDQVLRNPNNRASLRAQEIDLAWLVPRASTRRLGRVRSLRGDATGHLEVVGHANGPQLGGELDIVDTKLRLALVEERVGPINAHLVFAHDRVKIERIEVQSKKGPVIFSGHFNWANPGTNEVELSAHFDNFALTHFPLLDARVDGDIKIDGDLASLVAKGELALTRVQLNLPAPEDPLFREVRILGLERADADTVKQAEPSAYETAHADIAIDVRPGAKIRERGADIEAEGQLRLRKKRMGSTLFQGNLQTTDGTYTFLGRKFNVDEGVATFEERVPPDPELHLIATRPLQDVSVGVELTGRWSALQSRLISTPQMDDNEILSYLVFDKPTAQIGERDDQQLNAAAAQLAGNLALSQLSRALSEELPINEISVDVNQDMSVRSVGVETNVGEDIILRYDRALQSTAGDRLTVEWRFWKDLSLRSEYDANGGSSGLDLFWSYEY